MLPEQLISLIRDVLSKRCESQQIELKRAELGVLEKLYGTMSAFANQTGGGTIIFGIHENGGYQITGVYDPQDLQSKVTSQALQMDPVIRPVFTVAEIDGKTVVSAEIAECGIYDKPCFYKGAGRLRGSYIRVGDADLPMTEYEIYSYEVFRRKIEDELRPVERAQASDISPDALQEYFFKLRQLKPNLARLNEPRILQLQGLMQHDKPTLAGILLLGEYPQAFFPQLSITAMVIAGRVFGDLGLMGERFVDNKRLEGTLPQMLDAAMTFVLRNSRVATVIDENGHRADRPEYPMKAVREIILNALIHRDYSIHTDQSPIRILMFTDRLEVENPGGLYGRMTINELGTAAADTRNPFIANGMEVLHNTENRFSGIPTIIHEMKAAGLQPPQFESQRGVFRVTLFNSRDYQTPLKLSDSVLTSRYTNHRPISEFILELCSVPRSREELAAMLGIDSQYYLVRKYLKPLLKSGILLMTLPDKPQSKFQRYYRS